MQILSKGLSTKLHCSQRCQLAQYCKLNTKSEALRIVSSKVYHDFQIQRCCKTHINPGITTMSRKDDRQCREY